MTAEFGIPAVHIGPGDMLAGHSYDESVELGEVDRAVAFCAHLILEWSADRSPAASPKLGRRPSFKL